VDVGPEGTIAVVDGTFETTRSPRLGARIWDWRRDEIVWEMEGDFLATELGPDGDRIALAGPTSAWVRDIETGDELATLTGFPTPALDVTWSADGSRIATAHEDGSVRVWDAETGEPLLVLVGHDNQAKRVTFSPDGTRLASSQGDQDIRVWALDLDDLVDLARDEVTRSLTDDECREYLAVESCEDSSG
jgi:WD40 repeat protein